MHARGKQPLLHPPLVPPLLLQPPPALPPAPLTATPLVPRRSSTSHIRRVMRSCAAGLSLISSGNWVLSEGVDV